LVERVLAFVASDRERVAQSFLEEIGAPQPLVGLGDPVELVALAAGEVTGVLPQRIASLGNVLGVARRARRESVAGSKATIAHRP